MDELSDTITQARERLDAAKAYLEAGDPLSAQDACRELLADHAEYLDTLYTFGRAYMADANHEAALPCFARASMLDPDNPEILMALAEVYSAMETDEAAFETAGAVLEQDPGEDTALKAHLQLGALHKRRGDYAAAVVQLEKANARGQGKAGAAALLAACHAELGEPDKAAGVCTAALGTDVPPLERAQLLYELARQAKPDAAETMLSDIDALEDNATAFDDSPKEAAFAAYVNLARGSLFESQGAFERSWDALMKGNAPLRTLYGSAAQEAREAQEDALARARDFAGPVSRGGGTDAPLTLVILGPSCAGKTVLEQIVASIPGVKRGHESDIVHQSAARTANAYGLLPLSSPGQMPSTLHEPFSAAYTEELKARAGDAQAFTITHPDLIADLGGLAETVPNMKAVFIERDADDAALRLFGKAYPENINPFACDLPGIDAYLERYAALVDLWAGALPDIAVRITYEEMVADPGAIRAQIAAFCELSGSQSPAPEPGDDRGCANPYRDFMNAARHR